MEVRAEKKVTLFAFLLFIIMLMAPPINVPHGAMASTLMKENNGTTIRCIKGFLDEYLLANHDYLDLSSRWVRGSVAEYFDGRTVHSGSNLETQVYLDWNLDFKSWLEP